MLNSNLEYALALLEHNGYEAYLVGGAVRDLILNIKPHDYDIATNANIKDIINVFKDYNPKEYLGKGLTVGVTIRNTHFEISTYKGSDIIEDLSNRDFTMNSIAYRHNYIDPFNGINDINNKIIRATKSPDIVINTDPTRILRAIKFEAALGFIIDNDLKIEISKKAHLLKKINKERLKTDFDYLLLKDNPSYYFKTYFKVFSSILEALKNCYNFDQRNTKWHHLDVFEHTMVVLDSTESDLVLRLSALFHDIKKPASFSLDEKGVGHFYNHYRLSSDEARSVLSEFKYNKNVIDKVCKLVFYHDISLSKKESSLLKFLYKFGTDDIDLLIKLKKADILGQNPILQYRLKDIDEIHSIINTIIADNKIITYKNLAITGDDLKELGYSGKEIGDKLYEILELIRARKLKNNKDKIYEYLKKVSN